jgi:hypothetical protein
MNSFNFSKNIQIKRSGDIKVQNNLSNEIKNSFSENSAYSLSLHSSQYVKYKGLSGTIICFARNPVTQKMAKIRVLLDSGANSSLITRSLYKKLGLEGEEISLKMNVAGNQLISSKQFQTAIQLSNLNNSVVLDTISVTTIDQIGEPFAPIPVNPNHFKHLKNITFTESYPNFNARPFDMLLAEPHYSSIMLPGQRVSDNLAEPVAKETKLGWVLRGAIGIKNANYNVFLYNDEAALSYEQSMIYAKNMEAFDFSKFWTTENVGISPQETDQKTLTAQEIQAESLQSKTALYNQEQKRWFCELLWKDPDIQNHILNDNYNRAFALMKQVHKKVHPDHKDLVNRAMMEIFENGWSEKSPR